MTMESIVWWNSMENYGYLSDDNCLESDGLQEGMAEEVPEVVVLVKDGPFGTVTVCLG